MLSVYFVALGLEWIIASGSVLDQRSLSFNKWKCYAEHSASGTVWLYSVQHNDLTGAWISYWEQLMAFHTSFAIFKPLAHKNNKLLAKKKIQPQACVLY